MDWNALDDDLIEKIPEVDKSVCPDTYDNAEDLRLPRPRGVKKSRRRRSNLRRRRGLKLSLNISISFNQKAGITT